MKTSNYRNAGKDPGAISISVTVPRGFRGPSYPPLAPPRDYVENYKRGLITQEKYAALYRNAILISLDPRAVYADLVRLVFGEPVLLCWEEPEEFCHRQLVAAWFRVAGIECEEITNDGKKTTA